MSEQTNLVNVALGLTYAANESCSGDPREPFVALMTAAAISGHIIGREPEKMHKVLDQVMDLAMAAMLKATETPQ